METKFNCLAQRIVYSYLATFPEFSPIESDSAARGSQEQTHLFLRGLLQKLYDDPALLNLSEHEDECYSDWELQKSRPELIDAMRGTARKIDEFYLLLARLGEAGEAREDGLHVPSGDVKLPARAVSAMESFGLRIERTKDELLARSGDYPELAKGWKLLSSVALQSGRNPAAVFSRCAFNAEDPGLRGAFLSLVHDKEQFLALEKFFEENGYRRIETLDGDVTVDWVKSHAKKEEPLKAWWAERSHSGLSLRYDYRREHSVIFALRVPRYKELLARFDDMDDGLRDLAVRKTKHCDACGYCTQTDKTGTRQRQFVRVNRNGQHELCTYFPGFTYQWCSIGGGTAEDIMRFLAFTNRVLETK